MKCHYEPCNNKAHTAEGFCSVSCSQQNRYSQNKLCRNCKKPMDRSGDICSECKKANCLKQKKIDNAKRLPKYKPTDFLKRTGIPVRDDFMAKAYGWIR